MIKLILFFLLENTTKDRNDLLILFNSRINTNIPDENIFHDDIYMLIQMVDLN